MRIASSQYQAVMQNALGRANSATAELLQKMSGGKRLLVPSDDPIASVRLLRLGREEAAIAQYSANISSLKSRLTNNETYLAGMNRDMLDMRDHLLMTLEGSYTADDLRALAGPLKSLADSVRYAANSKDQEGRYLFSGTAIQNEAIAYDAGAALGSRYSFKGNTEGQMVMVGHGISQPGNVSVEHLPAMLNELEKSLSLLEGASLNPNDPLVGAQLRQTLTTLDQAHGDNAGKIARLGSSQNTLQMLADNHGNVSLSNQQNIASLENLDYAEASISMNSYMLALQASQKAYGRVSTLSLFDAL